MGNDLYLVERTILFVRGQKVILDADFAKLYGVTTKCLNQQVSRKRCRFREDFMFQLTAEEKAEVVADCDHLSRLKLLWFFFTRSRNMEQFMLIQNP
jgi:hypothetical protein